MIDWWYLIPTIILSSCFGATMIALLIGGPGDDD